VKPPRSLLIVGMSLAACSPVEQPLCGTPAAALEITTRTEGADRVTVRTARSGSAGEGQVIRIERLDGRLLALDEAPPFSGASAGTALRSVVVAYDDADRLSEASIIELDSRGAPLTAWQLALSYTDAGDFDRIEAAGQAPSSTVLDDVLGSILPGLSDGELTWLNPLPGADLLGPLPADIDAIVNSLPPGAGIAMAADISPIDGGLRADWVLSTRNLQLALPVEHVDTDDGWTRTWVGGHQTDLRFLVSGLPPEGGALTVHIDAFAEDGHQSNVFKLRGSAVRTVVLTAGNDHTAEVKAAR